MAADMEVPFLGKVPLDPRIGRCCDEGKSFLSEVPESPAADAYKQIIQSTLLISVVVKSAKYEIHSFVACFSRCFAFFTLRNKNNCCGLKKFVAKSKARVNFQQQILVLLLVFHQTLSTCHAANLLKLRDKLRGFVSRMSPR